MPANAHEKLPDQLQEYLRLVFVGTAASRRSASEGHYYAHPGNRFWGTIHEVGITSRRYQPGEFSSLLKLGIGFTDLCKSDAGMDHQISTQSIDVTGFRAKMEKYRPKTIAFTSKKAASLFYNRSTNQISLGRQPSEKGFPEVFVLSSPSGAASGHWTSQPWRELAEWIEVGPAGERNSPAHRTNEEATMPPHPALKAPPLSFATRTGDLLFISGIPGFDANGALPDSFETQFANVVTNIKRVLDEAGSSFRDLVKVNVLLTRASDVATMNALYAGAFGPPPYPARTTCVVQALPSPAMLIEIEGVAALKS